MSKKTSPIITDAEMAPGHSSDFGHAPWPKETSKKGVTRKDIALGTLARYSGVSVDKFQPFILLTNFPHYVDTFAKQRGVSVHLGPVLKTAHCPEQQISIVDYRVGSPMAALVVDVLSYLEPQTLLMLGLCGGLHRRQSIGDFLVPMAAIRGEGASMHYMPAQVPSLPSLMIQQFIAQELLESQLNFGTGVVHSTDYRMWEFDTAFKQRLSDEKASAIDMECSTIFIVGFGRKVPVGALMLISDLPLKPGGIKTEASSKAVFQQYTDKHLELGIASLNRMRDASREKKINFRRFNF